MSEAPPTGWMAYFEIRPHVPGVAFHPRLVDRVEEILQGHAPVVVDITDAILVVCAVDIDDREQATVTACGLALQLEAALSVSVSDPELARYRSLDDDSAPSWTIAHQTDWATS